MKNRTLGKNGFEVSEVGLGCWQIGADWGSEIAKNDAEQILDTAFENGIRFYDTADVYGDGRSEKLVGAFLKKHKDEVKVATKFGRNGDIFPDNYTEEGLRDCVENSLKRLGVDQLDLLQLHCIPTEELKKGDIFDWLRTLQKEGKIAHFGASVESVEEGLICLKQDGLQSLQVIFNIFRQKLVDELLPQAKTKGVGIIVRLPLASGLLTGKFDKDTNFDENDHRNFNQDGAVFNVGETFAGLPFKKGVELTNELKEKCPEAMSLAEMSLRWILDHDAVTTIIPGASSAKHIKENARASELKPLPEALMKELSEFYSKNVKQYVRGKY
ncbi:aldo/keto reductase [Flavimarina sp. Hel_I_48]|uniref:aldo/keto reductase n=1 Tax=Flavimarina sp. Hel_I_48 TaxID=1392488 RepID=UPI0004DFA293|nr:aldo/keto reductase [Flavimarina sp. Hel_I_48]